MLILLAQFPSTLDIGGIQKFNFCCFYSTPHWSPLLPLYIILYFLFACDSETSLFIKDINLRGKFDSFFKTSLATLSFSLSHRQPRESWIKQYHTYSTQKREIQIDFPLPPHWWPPLELSINLISFVLIILSGEYIGARTGSGSVTTPLRALLLLAPLLLLMDYGAALKWCSWCTDRMNLHFSNYVYNQWLKEKERCIGIYGCLDPFSSPRPFGGY